MSTAHPASATARSDRCAPNSAPTPRSRSLRRFGLATLGAVVVTASAVFCPLVPASAQANGSTLFTALGETQTATVPAGALGAYFLIDGGGGGQGYNGLGK